MSIPWSIAFGFGLASSSPNVIVPLLNYARDRNSDQDEDVSKLLLGALPFDIYISVVGFSIIMGALFNTNMIIANLHVLIGLTASLIGGGILAAVAYLVGKYQICQTERERDLAFGILCCVTVVLAFVGKMLGYGGAAATSVMLLWCFVNNCFDAPMVGDFSNRLKLIWNILHPLFFAVVGNALSIHSISLLVLANAFAVIVSVVVARFIATVISIHIIGKRNLSITLLCGGFWCAKATVQAALSIGAFDNVRRLGPNATMEEQNNAHIILVVYLLAIVISCPCASVWAVFVSRKLLRKGDSGTESYTVDMVGAGCRNNRGENVVA
ncbi:hypothetical protein HDU76_001756 [Blyttiomyces sp. JEL0837]|nr:hypothetical protein HDU76_001756 [Blyttiomyces sp. JEL0837]